MAMKFKSGGEGGKSVRRSAILNAALTILITTALIFPVTLGISALLALFFEWDEPVYYTAVRQTCFVMTVYASDDFARSLWVRSFRPIHYQAVSGSLLMLLVALLIGSRNLLLTSALPTLIVAIVGQIVVRIRQAKKLKSSTASP
jgi:hypothetical protein